MLTIVFVRTVEKRMECTLAINAGHARGYMNDFPILTLKRDFLKRIYYGIQMLEKPRPR